MSTQRTWQDLLNEHAQALVEGNEAQRSRARLLAQATPDLLTLMDTAEQVRASLRPVSPHPEFRERLKAEVIRRAYRRSIYGRVLRRTLRSYWLWGALASVLSVAGGVGYYLHRRSQVA